MRRGGPDYTAGLLLADLSLTVLALFLATLGRLHLPYGVHLTAEWVYLPPGVYGMAALVWLSVSAALSVYTPSRPYVRLEETRVMAGAILLSNLAFAGLLYMSYRDVPRLLFLYSAILQFTFLIGLRVILYLWKHLRYRERGGATRVLIVGAGRVGTALARRIRTQGDELTLVGYLDDDPDKLGQTCEGAPVLGTTAQATELVAEKQIEEVIFALPWRAHQSLETLVLALQAMPEIPSSA